MDRRTFIGSALAAIAGVLVGAKVEAPTKESRHDYWKRKALESREFAKSVGTLPQPDGYLMGRPVYAPDVFVPITPEKLQRARKEYARALAEYTDREFMRMYNGEGTGEPIGIIES